MTVAEIRPLVEQVQAGRFSGYMHAGHLVDALRLAKKQPIQRKINRRGERTWPAGDGLAVLQIDGPWCGAEVPRQARFRYEHIDAPWGVGVPYRARFRYTHIVASVAGGEIIYDGNAQMWLSRVIWEREVMADLVKGTKRATGWYTSSVVEVSA